jgi:hypothetical protein
MASLTHFLLLPFVFDAVLRYDPPPHIGGDETMSELITEAVNGESYRYYPLGKYVVRSGSLRWSPNFQIYPH